ncbi:MAG TPA: hypothetical protein DHW02_00885 [Ktedonobacter sp.]|nr:hypothetical protein [Ktedonobacter sp.]
MFLSYLFLKRQNTSILFRISKHVLERATILIKARIFYCIYTFPVKENAMMTQRQRLTYLPLAGIALLCILTAIYLAAGKRKENSEHADSVVKHTVETPAEDVLKHWTADRMREAQPAPLPTTNALKPKKRRSRRSSPPVNPEKD